MSSAWSTASRTSPLVAALTVSRASKAVLIVDSRADKDIAFSLSGYQSGGFCRDLTGESQDGVQLPPRVVPANERSAPTLSGKSQSSSWPAVVPALPNSSSIPASRELRIKHHRAAFSAAKNPVKSSVT